METSAPKRRKTSPTSNVPVGGSDASGPASSSLSSSSGKGTRRSSRAKRPSFASPTKTSLARANPEVLDQRNATRRGERMQERMRGAGRHEVADESFGLILPVDDEDEEDPPRQDRAPADLDLNSAGSIDADEQAVTAQLEGASEHRPTSDPIEPDVGPEPRVSEPQSPLRQAMRGMRGRPRRSMNVPSPRPLPPPSAQEEELLDPFKGRVLRRLPPRGVIPAQEPEEPDLPPTPTQKGISDPNAVISSPAGIHNTPSRRPRRSRALADKLRSGSSPLKQPPVRPIDLGLGKASSRTSKLPLRAATRDQVPDPQPTREEFDTGKPHPARAVREFDPFAEKKSIRDALREEATQLQRDLHILQKENGRLYASRQRRQRTSMSQELENAEKVLDVLSRHAIPPEKDSIPDPATIWLEAALDPMSFLPFGKSTIILPSPFQPPEGEDDSPPISHHPLSMPSAEELPYLQLFTPLTFHSSITFVPREPHENDDKDEDKAGPLMQQHDISVSSTPQGLFAARIEMLVNTKTLSIAKLSVPKLEPASAPELGPLVKKIVDNQAGSAHLLRRNASILTWAMAEWTRIASKRARFWCQVTEELEFRQGIIDCVQKMRQGRGKKRNHRQTTDSDAESSDREAHSEKKRQYTRTQLLPLMGRTSLDLDLTVDGHDEVELRITWRIGFDWTGEGRSTIGVLVQTPGKWHAQDDRRSLAGIPALFDTLLQKGSEPMDALRTVVSVLVGDEMA
ncbi:hypothetical protein TruAng_007576 [Truncatella angustata]|nr:hypothetical protein TruAng_007576 [Truncatella angustata]